MVFNASAEVASANLSTHTKTAYDLIVFKFQGDGNCFKLSSPPFSRRFTNYVCAHDYPGLGRATES